MTVKIDVKGPIISNDEAWIYEWFEMDATSPRKITEQLTNANGEDIIVSINSPGGYVDDGSEIYTALKNYSGHVETQIVGLAASAASFIATAGDKVVIAPTAQIMIHNASMGNRGDHRSMDKASQMLKTTDRAIVNAYVLKTGKDEQDLLDMMAEETWMGPQEALEHKFVDEIMFMDNTFKATASSAVSAMIPKQIIDNFRKGNINKGNNQGVTKEDLQSSLSNLKAEIINELQLNKTTEPKEPTPKPANKQDLSKLFLSL
ncbi:peptidase [Priestia aryabhattai]|uniref:head maturation protease, ClpP-related n=1 Tax=Priestia aryabhattai TaxID=412384 RepID=UPI000B507086|nr:head maturation protease, ClpP-related [Priestia aryabhattai]OVE34786.1 peptidase [Priestia aryabhattai]